MYANIKNKKILLAVTGSIATYKSIELARLLIKAGAEVRVVMTEAAQQFVTALTFQTISANPVAQHLFESNQAIAHIDLAKWADLIIVAPATANTIAKIANGIADNLLTNILLATTAPIMVAPAMNQAMYANTQTQENLAKLKANKVLLIEPTVGEQACGDVGRGRMQEPQNICAYINDYWQIQEHIQQNSTITNLKVLITAGPTLEAIDPVRFISNHSSGKMGFALAEAFATLGAQVTLVTGPVHLTTPNFVQRINIVSAIDLQQTVNAIVQEYDIFIGCAAVSDYHIAHIAENKIKKTKDKLVLELIKNPDIISEVAALTVKRPFVVGFAAETMDVLTYARDKLTRKNLDMICANDVSIANQGFNVERNAIHVICRNGEEQQLPLMDKKILAQNLVNIILQQFELSICKK